MSNPYDGGVPPYEPPVGGPYGGYAASNNPYGDPYRSAAPTDGLSIAALVCSLTCCAAPVGIGLGIAGIVRTKDGRRSGRWAAVTGLVVGIVMMLASVAVIIGLVWYGTNTVLIEDARAGDCIDVGDVDIWKAECDEPHDAEVIHAGQFDEELVEQYVATPSATEFCAPLAVRSGYADVVRQGNHGISTWVDSWDIDDPDVGDHFICVAEPLEGDLDAPLPRGERSEQTGTGSSPSALGIGDCFDEPGDASGDELIGMVVVVPCDEEHEFQYIGAVQVYGNDFPGIAAIERRAEACGDRFETYLRIPYDDSRYDFFYYWPTEELWVDGERMIRCLGAAPDGEKLTESLKGIRR